LWMKRTDIHPRTRIFLFKLFSSKKESNYSWIHTWTRIFFLPSYSNIKEGVFFCTRDAKKQSFTLPIALFALSLTSSSRCCFNLQFSLNNKLIFFFECCRKKIFTISTLFLFLKDLFHTIHQLQTSIKAVSFNCVYCVFQIGDFLIWWTRKVIKL
jgi:hypothetical protein